MPFKDAEPATVSRRKNVVKSKVKRADKNQVLRESMSMRNRAKDHDLMLNTS